jgi:hypothetical protein
MQNSTAALYLTLLSLTIIVIIIIHYHATDDAADADDEKKAAETLIEGFGSSSPYSSYALNWWLYGAPCTIA